MLDQSLLIGPRWQLSRALRREKEGIPGVGIIEGGMEEWVEEAENIWAEGLEGENDSKGRRSHFLYSHEYDEKVPEKYWKYSGGLGNICAWSKIVVKISMVGTVFGEQVSPPTATGRRGFRARKPLERENSSWRKMQGLNQKAINETTRNIPLLYLLVHLKNSKPFRSISHMSNMPEDSGNSSWDGGLVICEPVVQMWSRF